MFDSTLIIMTPLFSSVFTRVNNAFILHALNENWNNRQMDEWLAGWMDGRAWRSLETTAHQFDLCRTIKKAFLVSQWEGSKVGKPREWGRWEQTECNMREDREMPKNAQRAREDSVYGMFWS